MATGPWPAYMDGYAGGLDAYLGGTNVGQPIRGLNIVGATGAFDANTGILTVTVGGAGATGAAGVTGATGPQGATGATGPTP